MSIAISIGVTVVSLLAYSAWVTRTAFKYAEKAKQFESEASQNRAFFTGLQGKYDTLEKRYAAIRKAYNNLKSMVINDEKPSLDTLVFDELSEDS